MRETFQQSPISIKNHWQGFRPRKFIGGSILYRKLFQGVPFIVGHEGIPMRQKYLGGKCKDEEDDDEDEE